MKRVVFTQADVEGVVGRAVTNDDNDCWQLPVEDAAIPAEVRVGRRRVLARTFALWMLTGVWPERAQYEPSSNLCGTRKCINPQHDRYYVTEGGAK